MSRRDELAATLGVSVDQVCASILADTRVLKAVRGGLTEHLGFELLLAQPDVLEVRRAERGGTWSVRLADDQFVRVNVHSCDTATYADGTAKVDLRRSAPLAGERLYRTDALDVLAVSLFAATGIWDWRFARVSDLPVKRVDGVDYLDPNCRIDHRWGDDLAAVLAGTSSPIDQLALFDK